MRSDCCPAALRLHGPTGWVGRVSGSATRQGITSLQPQRILRDLKVDNQPGTVDQRRDKRRGDDRRVNAAALEHHWNDGRHDRAPERNAHQRQADDERNLQPDPHHPGADTPGNAERHGNHQRGGHLFAQYAAHVAQMNFTQRHGAHQRGGDLRPAVAARADQQRNKECQRDGGLQRLFKMLDDRAGVGFGDKQQQQPDGAFLPQAEGAGFQIGLLQRQRRPLKLGIFGDVIFQQMGNFALGQAADEFAVGHHGHDICVAVRQQPCNIGTFILRFDLQKLRNHQAFNWLYGICGL